MSIFMYFFAHSILQNVMPCNFRGDLKGAVERIMSLFEDFGTSGSPAAVKIDLLFCSGFLRSWRTIFLISRSVKILERPESDRFGLGDGTFGNLFTESIWRLVISAITLREVPLLHFLRILYFSLSVRDCPRLIAAKYLKKLWSPFTSKTQMAAKHDAQ